MTIKELKNKLKGQFTHYTPFHTDHRKAIPWTQLGKDLSYLNGKELEKALDKKEVVEYKLGDWQKTACWSLNELQNGKGHYEMTRELIIYFK